MSSWESSRWRICCKCWDAAWIGGRRDRGSRCIIGCRITSVGTRRPRGEGRNMEPFPHQYQVTAAGTTVGSVELRSDRLPVLRSAPASQFGGPGDRWSPETLLVGAVADCFILTFRAIARASKLSWVSLECDVTGTLERTDRAQFTRFDIVANLTVGSETDFGLAQRALEK